ncbi:hypothetical protein AB5N19_10211 [Seiridium cardinale]
MDKRNQADPDACLSIPKLDIDAQAPEVVIKHEFGKEWSLKQPGLEVVPNDKDAGLEVQLADGLQVVPDDAPEFVRYTNGQPMSIKWYRKRRHWLLAGCLLVIVAC